MSIKLTYKYIKNSINATGEELISKEYNGTNTKLEIKCKKAGHIYLKSWSNFNKGSMTQTRPSAASAIMRVVGYGGRNSNVMWFDPDNTWIEV